MRSIILFRKHYVIAYWFSCTCHISRSKTLLLSFRAIKDLKQLKKRIDSCHWKTLSLYLNLKTIEFFKGIRNQKANLKRYIITIIHNMIDHREKQLKYQGTISMSKLLFGAAHSQLSHLAGVTNSNSKRDVTKNRSI